MRGIVDGIAGRAQPYRGGRRVGRLIIYSFRRALLGAGGACGSGGCVPPLSRPLRAPVSEAFVWAREGGPC